MIISISGTPGSGKTTIAKELAKRLNYGHYSIGDIMDRIAKKRKIYLEDLVKIRQKDYSIDKKVDDYQITLGKKKDNFVIDSRLGFYFIPNSFKILFKCRLDVAAERIFNNQRETEKKYKTKEELKKALQKRMQDDKKIYKKIYGLSDFYSEKNFDLSIDTTELTVDEIIKDILIGIKGQT